MCNCVIVTAVVVKSAIHWYCLKFRFLAVFGVWHAKVWSLWSSPFSYQRRKYSKSVVVVIKTLNLIVQEATIKLIVHTCTKNCAAATATTIKPRIYILIFAVPSFWSFNKIFVWWQETFTNRKPQFIAVNANNKEALKLTKLLVLEGGGVNHFMFMSKQVASNFHVLSKSEASNYMKE